MKDIIAELPPYRDKEKLLKYAKELIDSSDFIDIPDAPLGIPSPSASLLSCIIKDNFPNANIITNLRLYDINRLSLINTIMALEFNGVKNFLLVRGDSPYIGNKIEDITPEDAIDLIKINFPNVRQGLLLNLNKTIKEIDERIKKKASFYLITRPWRSEKLKEVSKKVRDANSKLYIYFVLLTRKNSEFLLKYLPKEELVPIENLSDSFQIVDNYIDGIILSSPMDHQSLLKGLKILYKLAK